MTDFGQEIVRLKETGKLIRMSQFKRLWHLNYYDGPISGIGMLDGQFCYFDTCFENAWRRIFACYPLTKDEFKEELYRHELFRIHVGFHTDYHLPGNDGRRQLGFLHPSSEWDNYYKMKPDAVKTNYKDREPVAFIR